MFAGSSPLNYENQYTTGTKSPSRASREVYCILFEGAARALAGIVFPAGTKVPGKKGTKRPFKIRQRPDGEKCQAPVELRRLVAT